jgi:hypothetical protein
VRLEDLVERHEHPVWGASLQVRSLKKAIGETEARRFVDVAMGRTAIGEAESWRLIAAKIDTLTDRKAVLQMGVLPEQLSQTVRQIWTESVTSQVVLTGERRAHYLERHAEMRGLERELLATIFEPDEIHRNKRDSQIGIWYRRLNSSQYTRVVIWVSDKPGLQNSIHSFRLADEREVTMGRKQERLLWAKK